MKGLYLLLDGITLLFPLLLSFDKRVAYFRRWKTVFIASTLIAIPFLIWDIYFTAYGVWGFNDDYLVGVSIFHLPIEEILFFWVVPFACIFIYECCKYYFRAVETTFINLTLQIAMLAYIPILLMQNPQGWYTISIAISTLLVLVLWRVGKVTPFIGLAFLLSLIPFLLINGILTGSQIDAPIVWYSNDHFSGWRIFTIPLEDVAYAFSLIAGNILLTERLILNKTNFV